MSDGVGTTALPTNSAGSPVRIYLDTEPLMESATQPQGACLANFDAPAFEDTINGNRIDINQHFVVYVVKNGLIRVLDRHTPLKSILRAHKEQTVTDIRFLRDSDVLATVGSTPPEKRGVGAPASTVVIWRVFERSHEITNAILLEIRSHKSTITRVIWHPFNPNKFWMIHTNERGRIVATLVDTTTISTRTADSHYVCEFADFVISPNAVQVMSVDGDLNDLEWSGRNANHVLTSHSSGEIILWDIANLTPDAAGGIMKPKRLATVKEQFPVTRVLFLPHEHLASHSLDKAISTAECWTTCFASGSSNNSVLTLWSPFTVDGSEPQRAQVIELQNPPASCLIREVFGPSPPGAAPPSSFIVMTDRTAGNIWAFHCRASWDESGEQQRPLLVGADYVVPFKTLYPVYSWTVVAAPTTDITEEELQEQGGLIFDTKIFAYQSKMVQCLTLTSYMCLPPESTWTDPTPGVRVERIFPVHSAHVSEIGSDIGENLQYDEEYELDEDEDEYVDADEFGSAPDPSSLPTPDGVATNGTTPGLLASNLNTSNPFSNWLGALAAQPTAPDTAPAGKAPPASALPKPATEPTVSTPPVSVPPKESKSKKSSSRSKSRDGSNKKAAANKASPDGVKILKRDDAAAPEPVKPSPPASTPAAVASNKDEVRKMVHDEIKALVPELSRSIHATLAPSLVQSLKVSSNLGDKSVSDAIEEPLRQAFAHNMKTVFIPSIESITGQVLQRVSTGLETMEASKSASENKEVQALMGQVSKLTSVVEKLSSEVATLRSSLSQQQQKQQRVAATPPSAVPDEAALKAEVKALLDQKKFEAAFTKSVSASTADMAVYCCKHADISEVLGGDQARLSQPILICLMQQLGTVIASSNESDLQVEMEWLQDIALSLDPNDKRIHMHVPRVLEQLVANINARLSKGDPSLKRPLMRLLSILRGIGK